MLNRTKTRLLLGVVLAGSLLSFSVPAEAGRGWHRGGGNYYQFEELRRACHWGQRWACIEMGKIIGQRREARRERFYSDRFGPRYGWNAPNWVHPPPPPGFYFRFEGR